MRSKALPTLILSLLLALTFPIHATAAIKAGATCKKLGLISTSGSLKYTCIAKGKKLVWSKGVKVLNPIPKGTPTPTSTPTPTPTATQTPEPFQPTSLDDLIAHPESMSYWAWKKSGEKIAKGTSAGPVVTIHAGPHTALPNSKTNEAFLAAARLYAGFSTPATIHVIYYEFEDIAWGQSEFAKYAFHPTGQEAARQCATPETCWGALAEIDMKGAGIILAGAGVKDSNHTSGTLEAHEFTHTIQASQFVGTSKSGSSYCCIKAYLPYWAVEGGAEFVQAAAIYSNSFANYKSERGNVTGDFLNNSEGKFTADWIKSYLDVSSTAIWNAPDNNWRMYDVGFILNEALVAIKGPEISMQINKDVADGATWPQAFEKNFGVPWSDALPKLALALKAQLKS